MATSDQKNQFISLTATTLDPALLNKDRFQAFLGDPEAWLRFGEFISNYERRTYSPVTSATIGEVTFPEWSKGRILNGDIRRPKVIDFEKVITSAYFHPRQTGDEHKDNRPTGHEILSSLVASYKAGKDKAGKTYDIVDTDAIHGHFGLKELKYLEANWNTLPPHFKAWAKGKLLYGLRDVVRVDGGCLRVPALFCGVGKPGVDWFNLDYSWRGNEPGLRE